MWLDLLGVGDGSRIRTYPRFMNYHFGPHSILHDILLSLDTGLSPSSAWYANPCWLHKGGPIRAEEWMSGEMWEVGG